MNFDIDIPPEYAWVAVLCFVIAATLAVGGAIWGIGAIVLRIRRHWQQSVWNRAIGIYNDHPRELEDFIARGSRDLIEMYGYERRPQELPAYQRLIELTKEEALEGMLAHARENVRLSVENKALVNQVAELERDRDHKEELRQRHWRSVKRLRARQRAAIEPPPAETTTQPAGSKNGEH